MYFHCEQSITLLHSSSFSTTSVFRFYVGLFLLVFVSFYSLPSFLPPFPLSDVSPLAPSLLILPTLLLKIPFHIFAPHSTAARPLFGITLCWHSVDSFKFSVWVFYVEDLLCLNDFAIWADQAYFDHRIRRSYRQFRKDISFCFGFSVLVHDLKPCPRTNLTFLYCWLIVYHGSKGGWRH